VLVIVLIVMIVLMGMGLTSLFSGYTNLLTSTNLKFATQARNTAEAGINEALYRLSRQEGQHGAIAPDLSNPNWQVEIDFTSGDSNASDGAVSTVQLSEDLPEEHPAHLASIHFKKPDPAQPNAVLFYDSSHNPPFSTITLPSANIPSTAYPVIQITATGLDDRSAERQIFAEVRETTAFSPPAPLSSGVNVDLNGSGFLDGVNHDHRIYITPGSGNAAIYGDNATGGTDEVTDSHSGSVSKDSPDDNKNDNVAPKACGNSGDHDVANPSLTGTAYSSCARLFNMQIAPNPPPAGFTYDPTTPAWVGLQWINPVPSSDPHRPTYPNSHWHGTNTGASSAVALSSTPTVTRDQPPAGNVWTKGVFTWGKSNVSGLGTILPYPHECSPSDLVCRPTVLTHSPDSFSSTSHFPYFQEFLGLDDKSFQDLLSKPDTTKADLDAGRPPLGFTYIQGSYTFNASTASPGTNDFGLLYVTGDLTINGNQVFKGLVFIDGSLRVAGSPVILGAVMVRGSTQITVGTGNMKLIYSKKAAELGIQAAHPWGILTWEDTAIQGSAYTQE